MLKNILNFKMSIIAFVIILTGFIAALSWFNAIETTIDVILPFEQTIIFKYITVVIITTSALIIIFYLNKRWCRWHF